MLIGIIFPHDFPALSADNGTSYTDPTHVPNDRLLLRIELRMVNGSYDTTGSITAHLGCGICVGFSEVVLQQSGFVRERMGFHNGWVFFRGCLCFTEGEGGGILSRIIPLARIIE